MAKLTLISHHLCPYVQRAVIAVTEKEAPFTRTYVDLARKPDWFRLSLLLINLAVLWYLVWLLRRKKLLGTD